MEPKDLLRTENDENQVLNATTGTSQEDQTNVQEISQADSAETTAATEAVNVESAPDSVESTLPEETLEQNQVPEAEEAATTPTEPVATPADISVENTMAEIEPENSTPEVEVEAATTHTEPVATPADISAENTMAKIETENFTPEVEAATTTPTEPAANPAAISAEDMMAEIETGNSTEEEDDDSGEESEEESIEKVEAEYKALSIEDSVTELCRVVENTNYNSIKQRVGILRSQILELLKTEKEQLLDTFIQNGGVKEDFTLEPTELENKFHEALQTFRNNKNKYLENIELEKQRNLEAKNAIIEELRVLIESETNLKILNDKYKDLQEKWRNIGPVPQNESNNLWQNFHFYVEKFFDILRINKELRSLDLKKNLEIKIKLCEAAESLILQESINKSFKELQNLHNEWKEIGPVPEDKKEELWERFKNASDQINQRRREHYDLIYTEQQNSYNAKIVLCEQAEELITQPTENVKDYNTISDQLTEILKVWKTLDAAPPKVNEEIWTRFKSSLDKFFEKKKDFFQKIKDEQLQNYNLKLNLAIQAEAIAQRTDWRNATDEIIKLQKDWKNIGTTSRKHSELVWKRFRSACDKFFEAKSNYYSNVQDIEAENLKQKEDLIQRILKHQFGDDKNANMEAMKTFQREWTEMGYVPKKDKDRIYSAYREALDKRFADIKVSMEEVKRDNFKTKIDTILNNPNADRILDKEKRFLVNKLAQLKDEIAIWENNLGFFSNSKNADLLKEEFSKKIDAAKAEAKDLEYKIRMMNKPKQA